MNRVYGGTLKETVGIRGMEWSDPSGRPSDLTLGGEVGQHLEAAGTAREGAQ